LTYQKHPTPGRIDWKSSCSTYTRMRFKPLPANDIFVDDSIFFRLGRYQRFDRCINANKIALDRLTNCEPFPPSKIASVGVDFNANRDWSGFSTA
jgi:hypothetical protein